MVRAAGREIYIPDRASSVVLWALHCLRGAHADPRHSLELNDLVQDVLPSLSTCETTELRLRIAELGAGHPLLAVPGLTAIVGAVSSRVDGGASAVWERKVAQVRQATPWLQVIREARWVERPYLLRRAIWPSARDLRLMDPSLVDTCAGRCKSRWARFRRLVQRWWALMGG